MFIILFLITNNYRLISIRIWIWKKVLKKGWFIVWPSPLLVTSLSSSTLCTSNFIASHHVPPPPTLSVALATSSPPTASPTHLPELLLHAELIVTSPQFPPMLLPLPPDLLRWPPNLIPTLNSKFRAHDGSPPKLSLNTLPIARLMQ
jgi:hypothetical protein